MNNTNSNWLNQSRILSIKHNHWNLIFLQENRFSDKPEIPINFISNVGNRKTSR